MKPKLIHTKNSVHTLKIEDMTNLGSGVAHLDGAAVFVNGAVDGDTAEVKIIKCANGYYVGRLEKLLKASPYRIESDCPASKRCGGCVYRNISYDHELELKRRYVVSTFKKAGIEVMLDKVDSTGTTDGYRNKIQYPVGEDGSIGYYAGHTHDIIPCEDCRLQRREFDRPVELCGEFIRMYTHPGTVRHLYLRSGKSGVTVCLVVRHDKLPESDRLVKILTSECPDISGIMLNINKADTNVILGDRFVTLWGEPDMIDSLHGVEYRIAPAAFYQVNHDAAELLYARALEYASPKPGDHLLDLYCGAGTIGLYFASRCPDVKVTGIEIIDDAVVNARENAERNGITNAEFMCAELGSNDSGVTGADIAVLDPPRKGCAESVIERIAELGIPKVVYVSCAADTLA
nr:23S rRNA (uracil(1939)-C(5))-methyltransferase RlmD [Clostridia bacterium]